jgi:predicted DsbA family dithiol-disulfide isomerase
MDIARTVLHWFDFICPFCYLGQQRNTILERRGREVVTLPFQAHPDIPPLGIDAGARVGPMYTALEREAAAVGLPLHWPPRLPNSRLALAAAEWARQHWPHAAREFHRDLFAAHFALGEDLGDPAVIDRHAIVAGVPLDDLHAALADCSAFAAVREAELLGQRHGVSGTPAWLSGDHLILGLRGAAEFERL